MGWLAVNDVSVPLCTNSLEVRYAAQTFADRGDRAIEIPSQVGLGLQLGSTIGLQ